MQFKVASPCAALLDLNTKMASLNPLWLQKKFPSFVTCFPFSFLLTLGFSGGLDDMGSQLTLKREVRGGGGGDQRETDLSSCGKESPS